MTFLDPTTIAVAAGLTIPPLVALYFLKLRRAVRLVPSTLLWKKAVEDLRVNAPFQRLRKSLLLLLQSLVLILAAIALGKPMLQSAQTHRGTVILLIDQSASMNVIEHDGRTRLELAKEQARRTIDAMADDARAMVIAFCDRATVVSSFDTDKQALRRKVDSIEPTESTTSLVEAVALAEAYSQNLIIGGESPGSDIAPVSAAPAASVFLFTDGRIEDADKTPFRRIDPADLNVVAVGSRKDNVAILGMAARRDHERPQLLDVTATVRNFDDQPRTFDATLYIDGRHVDSRAVSLDARSDDAGRGPAGESARRAENESTGDVRTISFRDIEFSGGGLVEVALRIDDALAADDRAWTVVAPPRPIRALLVSPDDYFLPDVLATLDLELTRMTPEAYESAPEDRLASDRRSLFDVVIIHRHSTGRLPRGNYFFWGGVPRIDGVELGPPVRDEIFFDWDETHPLLRYVAVKSIDVLEWSRLRLPAQARSIIDGQTSPVLAWFTSEASQFLVCAFPLVLVDERGAARANTDWVVRLDFVVFMQNAVQFLSASDPMTSRKSVAPGESVSFPIPPRRDSVNVVRPDGATDPVPAAQYQMVHYHRTRAVGPYRVEPGLPGHDLFAVNLFHPVESDVAPPPSLSVGHDRVSARTAAVEVSRPAWRYVLWSLVGVLLVEWIVYNRRVMV